MREKYLSIPKQYESTPEKKIRNNIFLNKSNNNIFADETFSQTDSKKLGLNKSFVIGQNSKQKYSFNQKCKNGFADGKEFNVLKSQQLP